MTTSPIWFVGNGPTDPLTSVFFVLQSSGNVSDLHKRLRDLKAAQKRAQVMQYGIWTDWQHDKLTDRVVSTAKRTALKGFQKVVDRIR